MCKQPGLFFGIFAAALLISDAMVVRPRAWLLGARHLAWLSLGMSLPLALTCFVLWRAGTFERFWFWTFEYARVYGGLQTWAYGMDRLREYFASGCDRWFHLTGAIGLIALFWRKAGGERRFFFAALLFCSFFATAAGLYFSRHYFVLMLPVICLLVGDFVAWAADALNRKGKPLLRAIPPALFIAVSLGLIWENRGVWFELPMAQACKEMYLAECFVECQEIGNYIREHSSPRDRIEVFGSEPEVYFYAQRHSASGYIYMYDLARVQPHAAAMRREFMDDVERLKPRFLVLVNVGTSWMPWPKEAAPFIDWINLYPKQFYELIGLAEVDQTNSAYFWDPDSIAKHENTPTSVLLFRRK